MKVQRFAVDGVTLFVPVYKVSPWTLLGYPELPTVEATNDYIIVRIGSTIASVVKESVHGQVNTATGRYRVKQALNSIGYWPNPKVSAGKRTEKADSWIEGIINTSVKSAQSFRAWA